VEPAVELEADFLEEGDALEALGFVEGDAGGLLGVDAGDDRVVAEGGGAGDQVDQKCAADALAVVLGVDVDGVLDGSGVCGAFVKGGEGAPADDSTR
jgi:hypothetical protein